MSDGTPTGYSAAQVALHWIIMALILFQLVFGEAMEAMVDAERDGNAAGADSLMGTLHIVAGVAVLVLAAVRLALRLGRGAPAPLGGTPLTNRLAAVVHGLFYAVMVAAPVSGLVAYYVTAAANGPHKLAKPVLIVLILVHVLGALWHALVRKDGTLRRMLVPQG